MRLQSNKGYYALILLLTSLRVFFNKPKACPADFDCNSYLAMAHSLAYDPHIAGHHAMRVLPAILAGMLEKLGMSLEWAFRLLSGGSYIAFGLLTFWFLRRFAVKPAVAFGFTLLCLAAHHAMRIPLQLVYQTCDMMVYPLCILMIYCSLKQQTKWLFALSLLGILVRQNLFILGICSLLYCFWQTKQSRVLLYAGIVTIAYSMLQWYYHATSTFTALLSPPEDFFSVAHLYFVLTDSQIVELFVPLLPFMVIYAKSLVIAMWRYWHVTLYMAVTIGQPLLAYHMTGKNLPRLALQGVIGLYVLTGMVSVKYAWPRTQIMLFLCYAFFTFMTWGLPYRLFGMILFGIIFGWLNFRAYRSALPVTSMGNMNI